MQLRRVKKSYGREGDAMFVCLCHWLRFTMCHNINKSIQTLLLEIGNHKGSEVCHTDISFGSTVIAMCISVMKKISGMEYFPHLKFSYLSV